MSEAAKRAAERIEKLDYRSGDELFERNEAGLTKHDEILAIIDEEVGQSRRERIATAFCAQIAGGYFAGLSFAKAIAGVNGSEEKGLTAMFGRAIEAGVGMADNLIEVLDKETP